MIKYNFNYRIENCECNKVTTIKILKYKIYFIITKIIKYYKINNINYFKS